jgi:hypothetical protein
MRSRLTLALASALFWALWVAPPALAQAERSDNGEGLLGETDDKVVTFFSLGVVVFFTLLVILATLLQQRLERRKEEKEAARIRQRIGW